MTIQEALYIHDRVTAIEELCDKLDGNEENSEITKALRKEAASLQECIDRAIEQTELPL